MTPAPVISAGAEMRVPARRKKKGVSSANPVVQEYPGDDQAGDVGGQHGFAAGLGGQPAQAEQDDQQQFDFGLGDPVAEVPDRKSQQPGQHGDGDGADGDKDQQQPAVGGEESTKGQHGAQVGDEACGEDELAEVMAVQPGLDHDCVHHGD